MILPLNLNRRHKVTLFLTVLLAGIAALNGAKMMQVVGILLLGLALAWAFGSDSRVVHWLFLSVGVFLACGTVGLAWLIHQRDTNIYAQKVAAFEQRIPELAKEYPLHKVPAGPSATRPTPIAGTFEPLELQSKSPPKSAPPSESSLHVTWDEPAGRQPVTPSPQTKSSGVTLDFSKAQPIDTNLYAILDKDLEPYLVKNPKKGATYIVPHGLLPEQGFVYDLPQLFGVTMPDGHVRYFAYKRDADNCQQDFFAWGKTQKMWNEASVAGLDLSEVRFDELPGAPPKPLWLMSDDWWVSLGLGVFLFALGLGLILGIRAKPLPT
jgi:hypothetical protein